jgi:hypothetical protein
MSGHDADSCRANQLSDGRILCVICASIIAPFDAKAMPVYRMPYAVRCFVAAMLREKEVHAPSLKLTMATFGPDGSSSQAAAACAQGTEGVILNYGALIFSADRHALSKLEVRFQADELDQLPKDFAVAKPRELDVDAQAFLRQLKLHSCPPALEAAIGKLITIGFSVRHTDFSGASMRRIQLHCGGNIAGTKVPKGIIVEATYLV